MVTSQWRLRVLLGLNLAFLAGVLTGCTVLSIVALLMCMVVDLTCWRLGPEDLAAVAPLVFCLVWLATESVFVSSVALIVMVAGAIMAEVGRRRRRLAQARAQVIADGRAAAKRLGFTGYIPIKAKLTNGRRAA